jgi:hypothetical protein
MLVRREVLSTNDSVTDEAIFAAVRAAAGRPFLAEVLGRGLATGADGIRDADSTLAELVRAVTEKDRRFLSIVAAADDWIDLAGVAEAAEIPVADALDAVDRMVRVGILRRGRAEALDTRVALFHDGVRTAALLALSTTEKRDAHSRLADRLLERSDSAPERVVRHLMESGRTNEASENARRAARHAEAQRAFSLASDMYQVALLHPGDDRPVLLEARAGALERAPGRYGEACGLWRSLAAEANGDRRAAFLLRESHALLAANRTSEGLERLDETLVAAGYGNTRTTGLRAVVTLARFVAGPVPLQRRPTGRGDLQRAERHMKIGVLLSFLEPLTGMDFLQRARREFLAAGAGEHVAGCDYTFAILALFGSRRPDRVRLAERYRAAADARIGSAVAPPEVRGMPYFIDGLCAFRQGNWTGARRSFQIAVDVFSESNGTTERMMAMSWGTMSDAYVQDVRAMKANHEWFARHASECGGTFIASHVKLLEGYVQFLEGRIEESKQSIQAIADMFDGGRPNTQRAAGLIYRHLCDIYLPRDNGALREYNDVVRRARRFAFFRSTYAGPFAQIGALLEAQALRAGEPGASAKRVEYYARIIDASPPLAAGAASRARAYAADATGRPDLAIALLERAEREARRYERRVDAEIARYQRGLRIGGDEGAALCQMARDAMSANGAGLALLDEDAALR